MNSPVIKKAVDYYQFFLFPFVLTFVKYLEMLSAIRASRLVIGRRAYTTGTVSGIKTAVKPSDAPISEISVVINAGSRFDQQPGAGHLLEKFAFRNTANRSALRFARESELLGGQVETFHDRDNIVLKAKFLKRNLPFYVEALGDVLQNTLFNKYELVEDVLPLAAREAEAAAADAVTRSREAAYEAAFRTGLGNGLYVEKHSPVSIDEIKKAASAAYTKANIAVAGFSVVEEDFNALIGEHFGSIAEGAKLEAPETKTYAGDIRIRASGPNAVTLAFPTDTPSSALAVVANILGGTSSIKWAAGSSLLGSVAARTGTKIDTTYTPYSDAAVLAVTISGPSSSQVNEAVRFAAREIREISSTIDIDLIQKAVNRLRFHAAESAEGSSIAALTRNIDISVSSVDAVIKAASAISGGNVAVGTVGEIHKLPYGSDLFY